MDLVPGREEATPTSPAARSASRNRGLTDSKAVDRAYGSDKLRRGYGRFAAIVGETGDSSPQAGLELACYGLSWAPRSSLIRAPGFLTYGFDSTAARPEDHV